MDGSTRKDLLHAAGVILAASVATFAAAVAITMSGPAFAAPHDYRFEVTRVASSAPALAWNAPQSIEQMAYAGRVVKVDADAGKIMIEHRPIWRLYMESMTMIFKVRDGAMLTGLTPGDKIRFKVGRAGDGFVVTWIENSN